MLCPSLLPGHYGDGNMSDNTSSNKYKADYPYLVHWKQQGFDNFPTVPPEVILANEKKVPETLAAELGEGILADIALREQHQRKIDEFLRRKGSETVEFLMELDRGTPRNEVMRKWANSNLPNPQGGSVIPNEERRVIIKRIYYELIDCIKDVRTALDVPLRETEGYDWSISDEIIEANKEMVPEADSIFEEKEFYLLFQEPSIRNVALKILRERLIRFAYLPFTTRTLQDIIYKTNL